VSYLDWTLRSAVALVLIAAAAGKLFAGPAARTELAEVARRLGVPAWLAGPAAVALAVVEAAIAVLIAVPTTAVVGGGAAVALFAGFAAGVHRLVGLASGLSCRCFGAASALGRRHVVRNLVLVVLSFAATALTLAGTTGPGGPAASVIGVVLALPIAAGIVGWDHLAILAAGRPNAPSRIGGSP
jgi:hypothetical protein